MQDLIVLNKNSSVIVQKDGKIYEDSYDNFILDYGELPKIEYIPNGHVSKLSIEIIQIDYNCETKHCYLNGNAFQTYPNEVCENVLNSIDNIIAAKTEREYKEQTQAEKNQEQANAAKAELRSLAETAMMAQLAGGDIAAQQAAYQSNIATLSDDVALLIPEVYPVWSGNGIEYKKDTRVTYNGVLYKVLQDHTSQETWTPTDAPSLFAKVLTSTDGTIPDWEQPTAENAYMKGDKVRYNGKVYESLIDNNVWKPDEYPAGWKEVAEN